jgi:hypothetical protein
LKSFGRIQAAEREKKREIGVYWILLPVVYTQIVPLVFEWGPDGKIGPCCRIIITIIIVSRLL